MTIHEINIYQGLKEFLKEIRVIVAELLRNKFGERWPSKFRETLLDEIQKKNWTKSLKKVTSSEKAIDYQYLSVFAEKNDELLYPYFDKHTRNLPTWFSEIATVRNFFFHFNDSEPLTRRSIVRAWDNMIFISEAFKMEALREHLILIRKRRTIEPEDLENSEILDDEDEESQVDVMAIMVEKYLLEQKKLDELIVEKELLAKEIEDSKQKNIEAHLKVIVSDKKYRDINLTVTPKPLSKKKEKDTFVDEKEPKPVMAKSKTFASTKRIFIISICIIIAFIIYIDLKTQFDQIDKNDSPPLIEQDSTSQQAQKYTNDSTVKIYYDASAKTLATQDSIQAKYYRVINFRDGKISGPVSDYYISGMPYMTGYYTDKIGKGYENGKFVYYFENGKIFQIRNYVNGLLDSVFLEFYPSGSRKARVSYSKGNKYGCEYAWDENGNLTRNAFIENNQVNPNIKCNTLFMDQLDTLKKIDPPQTQTPVITPEIPTNNKVSQNSEIKDCEKKNTGDYCFTNSTGKDLFFTLYIPKENTGKHVQLDRFNFVSVSWYTEVWVNTNKTSCFDDLPAGEVNYRSRDALSFSESTIDIRGTVTVEVCKAMTYVIK